MQPLGGHPAASRRVGPAEFLEMTAELRVLAKPSHTRFGTTAAAAFPSSPRATQA